MPIVVLRKAMTLVYAVFRNASLGVLSWRLRSNERSVAHALDLLGVHFNGEPTVTSSELARSVAEIISGASRASAAGLWNGCCPRCSTTDAE